MNLPEKTEDIVRKGQPEGVPEHSGRNALEQELEYIEEDIRNCIEKNRKRWRKVMIVCILVILVAAGKLSYTYVTLNRQYEEKIDAYQKKLEKEYQAYQDS